VLLTTLCVFAIFLFLWPLDLLLKRVYRQQYTTITSKEYTLRYRIARWLMRFSCALSLLLVIVIATWLTKAFGEDGLMLLSEKYDLWLFMFFVLNVVAVVGGVGVGIVFAVLSWLEPSLGVASRVWNAVVGLSTVGFAFFMFYWNMLSFNFHY